MTTKPKLRFRTVAPGTSRNGLPTFFGGPLLRFLRSFVACAGAAVIALQLAPVVPCRASETIVRDPWYRDLSGHWARSFIRVLWEEDAADGYVYPSGLSYFRPDLPCDRAQFLLLLARALDLRPVETTVPSYTDLGPNYTILNGKRVWPYVEACVAEGISFVPGGGRLYPAAQVTREDAVEFIVRCLDLWQLAQAIPYDEAGRILSRFPDGRNTSPDRTKSMALAVNLGIVQGCGDGTLQPRRAMMRCEMATLVYRSCLVRVEADPAAFSPDGDGIDESTEFRLMWLKNRNIVSWDGSITDGSGLRVFSFNPALSPGPPPPSCTWNGTDASGRPLPAGRYFYQVWVRDRLGNQFFSVRKPLDVIKHSLSARIYPEVGPDGTLVSVMAQTCPSALSATARFSSGHLLELSPSPDGRSWAGTVQIGPWLPVGTSPVIVEAVFAGARREGTLSLTRLDPLTLRADVRPNPALPGQTVELSAATGQGVEEVNATLFGETVPLKKAAPGSWYGTYGIPVAAPSGPVPVIFEARTEGRRKAVTVILTVEQTPLVDLAFVLSR